MAVTILEALQNANYNLDNLKVMGLGMIVEWEYSRHQHHVDLNCDIAFEGEILGNIHQHPELLKTEKV